MKKKLLIESILYCFIISILSNSYTLIVNNTKLLFIIIPVFLLANIFAGMFITHSKVTRLRICSHGTILLTAFYISLPVCVAYHIFLAVKTIPDNYMTFIWSAVFCICVEAVFFWNGIISVYLASAHMGFKQRATGLICGMIPIANLIMLYRILKTTYKEIVFEVEFEKKKKKINAERKHLSMCNTKYPVLLVHGVFFRDSKNFNYWGRIPAELEQHGAVIYYGNHPSASSISDSATFLANRIKEIVQETGCEKVNIIAHSKGGLDCRYAISKLDVAPYVASLTTINTPHKGCQFADNLLSKLSPSIKNSVAAAYNSALKKFGEADADFLAAVNDLTESVCTKLDKELTTPPGIYCQSVGSALVNAQGGKFPLNMSYHLVNFYDEKNDGLVCSSSFEWGEKYTFLTPEKERGISHGDMIDLNRENIDGFDVREFYVGLVNDLKERGL